MEDKEYDTVIVFLKTKIAPVGWSSEAVQFYRQHCYVFDGKLYEMHSKLPIIRRGDLFQSIMSVHISLDGQHLDEAETVKRLVQNSSLLNAETEVRQFIEGCRPCLKSRIQRQSDMLTEQAQQFSDQQQSMLDEMYSIKEENHRLSQSFDRQLTTNRRVLRLKEKWRLKAKAKAGKFEITRLQDCSETKAALTAQYGDGLICGIDAENRFQCNETGSSKKLENLTEIYQIELQSKDVEINQLKKCIGDKEDRLKALSEKAPRVSFEISTLREDLIQTKAQWTAAEVHNRYLVNNMAQLQTKLRIAQEELASEMKQREELNSALIDCKEQLSNKQTLLENREVEMTFVTCRLESAERKLVNCSCHKRKSNEITRNAQTVQLIASLEGKLNAARSEFNRLQVEFSLFKSEKDKLEQKVKTQKKELVEKTTEYTQAVAALQNEKTEIICQHLAKIKELEKALDKKTDDHLSAQQSIESKSASLATLEEQTRKFEEELRFQKQKRSQVKMRFNEKSTALLAVQEMLKKKCDEVAGVQMIAEANKSLLCAAQEKVKTLQAEVSNAQATIGKQNDAIEDLMNRTQTMHEALSEAKIACAEGYNRFKQLEAGLKQKEGELVMERLLVKQRDSTIATLEKYAETMRKNINVEKALKNEFLQNNVVMKVEVQKERAENVRLQTQLKHMTHFSNYAHSASGHQATLSDTLNGLNSMLQEKDAEILQCKHEMATMQAVIENKEKLLAELQSFHKQQADRLRQIENASTSGAAADNRNILEFEQRIGALINETACKEQKISELRQTVSAFTGDLQKTKDRLKNKDDACKELEATIECYRVDFSKKQKKIEDLNEKLNTAMLGIKKLERNLSEVNKSNGTLFAKVQSSEQAVQELEQRICSVTVEAVCKEEQIKDLQEAASASEEKVAQLKLQIGTLTKDVARNKEIVKDLRQKLLARTETTCNDQRVLDLEKTINTLTSEAVARDGQILELEAKLINEEARRDKMQEKLTKDARDMKDLTEALNALAEKHEKLQESLAEGERDIQAYQSFQDVDQNLRKTQHAELKEHKRKLSQMKCQFKANCAEKKEQAKQIAKLKWSANSLRAELDDRNRQIAELKCELSGCKLADRT